MVNDRTRHMYEPVPVVVEFVRQLVILLSVRLFWVRVSWRRHTPHRYRHRQYIIWPIARTEALRILVDAILYRNGFMHSDRRRQMYTTTDNCFRGYGWSDIVNRMGQLPWIILTMRNTDLLTKRINNQNPSSQCVVSTHSCCRATCWESIQSKVDTQ